MPQAVPGRVCVPQYQITLYYTLYHGNALIMLELENIQQALLMCSYNALVTVAQHGGAR